MPHCIIEYSQQLEPTITPADLLNAVYRGALQSELFTPDDIKVRTHPFQHHLSGETTLDFIHVSIRILSGRDEAQKKQLSHLVLQQLEALPVATISLTVEILDIDRDSYAKTVR